MKTPLVISIVLILCSCNHKLITRSYTSIQPWKEWQVVLKLNADSSFSMIDTFGCNTFYYIGRWRLKKDTLFDYLILTDTTPAEYLPSHDAYKFFNQNTQKIQYVTSDKYFPVISSDTAYVFENNKMIRLRGLIFKRHKSFQSLNLSKERVQMLKAYYIGQLGKKLFIKTFGNGKGMKGAKEFLMQCENPPIPLRFH